MRKQSFSATFTDPSAYKSLKNSQQSYLQHNFNPDYTFYVGTDFVMVSMVYSGNTMTKEEAKLRLSWFFDGIPHGEIN